MGKIKLFHVWKADSNCEPIDGTDRMIRANSMREVMRMIAFEEKIINHIHNSLIVRLPHGDFWTSFIGR